MKYSVLVLALGLTACGDSDVPVKNDPLVKTPVTIAPPVSNPTPDDTPVVEDPVVEDPVVEDPVVEDPVSPQMEYYSGETRKNLGTVDMLGETAGIVGIPYKLRYTTGDQDSCTITGDITETVTGAGYIMVTPTEVGVSETTMTCDTQSTDTVSVDIIPKVINIPDPVFADVLVRLGYTVTDGTMTAEDVMDISSLCVDSRKGMYTEVPNEHDVFIIENTTNEFYKLPCAYTDGPEGVYISDVSGIEYFVNLTKIGFIKQQITNINLLNMKKLQYLNMIEAPLIDIDLSNSITLDHLVLTGTSLTELDVTMLTELDALEVKTSNDIIDYRELPVTESNGTVIYGLTKLDLSKNTKLRLLWLTGNPLTEFNFGDNKHSLAQLSAPGTAITGELDLSGFTRLNYTVLNNSPNLTLIDARGIYPYRFYTENVPQLHTVYTHDLSLYASKNVSGIWSDEHVNYVELD